ncbi:hypothetical protein CTM_21378, partial [Clostridium tetanomorphum DSM 665]
PSFVTIFTYEEAWKYIKCNVLGIDVGFKTYFANEISNLPKQIVYKKDGYTYIYDLIQCPPPTFYGVELPNDDIVTKDGGVISNKLYGYKLVNTNEPVVLTGTVSVSPIKWKGKAKIIKGRGSVVKASYEKSIDFSNVKVKDFIDNPKIFKGKSAKEIAQMLEESGYEVEVVASKRSRSGAQIIKIKNSGEGKNISQVQVSSGGGRHGENPYVKVSTTDEGRIKIIDGPESTYKTNGDEKSTIIFTEE